MLLQRHARQGSRSLARTRHLLAVVCCLLCHTHAVLPNGGVHRPGACLLVFVRLRASTVPVRHRCRGKADGAGLMDGAHF